MKIPKLKTKQIKEFLKRIPRILGARAFLTFLWFLFFSLIGAGLIFYRYSILAEKQKLEVSEEPLQFKEEIYQQVLSVWQEKEKGFEGADLKEYPDPFRGKKEEPPNQESLPEEEIPEEEIPPELPVEKDKELQEATNLEEFYRIKGEKLPPVKERAKLWEGKGLGPFEEYVGSRYQNLKLLEELKKELTE